MQGTGPPLAEVTHLVSQGGDFRYDAFVSYSRDDRPFARALQRSLERRYRRLVPPQLRKGRRVLAICRDETDLTGAADLAPILREHIAASRMLLVVCSPSARDSVWVDSEIRAFRDSHGKQGNRGILAILHRGDDPPRATAFPVALLEDEQEPLAIEFRRDRINDVSYAKYAKEDGLLRLFAPLLAVEYPALRNRHHEFERRRLKLTLSGISLLAIILGVAAVFSFLQYREAERQRQLALSNLDDAMLGYLGLAQEQTKLGRLVEARESYEYFKQLGAPLGPTKAPGLYLLWATVARNLFELAEANAQKGDEQAADRSYRESEQMTKRLLKIAEFKVTDPYWNEMLNGQVRHFGRPGLLFAVGELHKEPTTLGELRALLSMLQERRQRHGSTQRAVEHVTLSNGLTYDVATEDGMPLPFENDSVAITSLGILRRGVEAGSFEWMLEGVLKDAGHFVVTVTSPEFPGTVATFDCAGPAPLAQHLLRSEAYPNVWRWLNEPGVTWIPFVFTFQAVASHKEFQATQWVNFGPAAKSRFGVTP